MSRLLFAAARGARIEPPNAYEYASVRAVNGKVQSKTYWIARDTESGCIHPEDEALQYGPISTALREAAAAGNAWVLTSGNGRAAAAIAETHKWDWHTFPEEHRSLFLLFMAEALADEGL